MAANKLGSAWSSMKTMVGLQRDQRNDHVSVEGFNSNLELAGAFNCFFNCFNTVDSDSNIQGLKEDLVDSKHFIIEQRDIERAFHRTQVNKSPDPDRICGCLLKTSFVLSSMLP